MVPVCLFLSFFRRFLAPDFIDFGLNERYFFESVARMLPVLVELVDGARAAGFFPADFLVDASVEPAAGLALFPGFEPVVVDAGPVFFLEVALCLCGQVGDVFWLAAVEYPAVGALLLEFCEEVLVLALEDGRPGLVLEELVDLELQAFALFIQIGDFLAEGARLSGEELLLGAQA